MKRILFNDQVALTAAVLEGRKTQTRRVVLQKLLDRAEEYAGQYTMSWQKDEAWVEYLLRNAPYKVGEVVAVSQSYKDVYTEMMLNVGENFLNTIYEKFQIGYVENSPAWGNKMYVCAELMPHKVEITSVGVCRLQYISDKDCMAEGVQAVNTTIGVRYAAGGVKIPDGVRVSANCVFTTPKDAFAALIGRTCGKLTWNMNPWVYVFEFKLVQ